METIFTLQNVLNFMTLAGLEIVLGIDNVIFIALVVQGLPKDKMNKAKYIGISLALLLRVLLLFSASFIISMTKPFFYIMDFGFSGRNLLLIAGGLFLIGKCAWELWELFSDLDLKHIKNVEPSLTEKMAINKASYFKVILEIIFIDFIFSFDSVIVAVGMTNDLNIMIAAVVTAMIIMVLTLEAIGNIIHKYPSIKIIAINFILLVGAFLVASGFNYEIDKAYLYFAMFFSVLTEILSIRFQKKREKFLNAGGSLKH